ncbi:DUF692 family multinuclear iron-containing protein [Halobacillus sp. Marseille-Q1614]|uniref:multinuclear nonheme iron-dependent oxidase n=1 Tax=Halobacillus sp. Marseille-Q1614 TaxID=2709134 RepID=UPI001570CE10|nr:DUF692 family multinuclear iron-containing protein [Halobacillus sp. Marseille-Q1614]
MKFAINYSPEAKKLVDDQQIEVDLFKCPDFDRKLIEDAKNSRPPYIHFDLNAGANSLSSVNWKMVDELLKDTSTPYINLHLVAYSSHFPNLAIDTFKEDELDQIIEPILLDINRMAKKYGEDRIILENVVYRDEKSDMQRAIIDPRVISRIVEETGCGLLLDIAHAQMTCFYTGEDVYQYLSKFPVNHLKELHITGIQKKEGKYRDSMPMSEKDWKLAAWVLENIKKGLWQEPWAASFEYGGVGPIFEWRTNSDVIKEQTPRLYQLVKG